MMRAAVIILAAGGCSALVTPTMSAAPKTAAQNSRRALLSGFGASLLGVGAQAAVAAAPVDAERLCPPYGPRTGQCDIWRQVPPTGWGVQGSRPKWAASGGGGLVPKMREDSA